MFKRQSLLEIEKYYNFKIIFYVTVFLVHFYTHWMHFLFFTLFLYKILQLLLKNENLPLRC